MKPNQIPLEECKDRTLYVVRSRNLNKVAVFDKQANGFVGLRTKFDSIYVFTEYHWDTGAPYGTCNAVEELPDILPETISMSERLGTECHNCNSPVEFVKDTPDSIFGHWFHLSETSCKDVRPVNIYNKDLHKWLENAEEKYKWKYSKNK